VARKPGEPRGADEAERRAKELLSLEEAKSELLINTVILAAILPGIALMMVPILLVQGFSPNATMDLVALCLAAAYYLPHRLILRRGGYRPAMKYVSSLLNVTLCSLTLVGYSWSSGWIHSARSAVVVMYAVIILVSGLYHSPRLPLATAALAVLQYSGIAAYAVLGAGVALSPIETFGSPAYSLDVYALLVAVFLLSGLAAAYGGSRFRANLARALRSEASREAIAALDAQKTYFFSNVSHELRTPLTLILSPLDSMLAGDLSYMPEKHRGYLGLVRLNALRLLKLINNLLDFTKLEAGMMELRRQKTDLGAALESYVAALRPAAEAKGLGLELSVEAGRPGGIVAAVDRNLFEKAVFNLLSNALKFTASGGRIQVALRSLPEPGGGRFELSVADSGIGIAPDQLDFVFERFSQVDSSLARKYEGSGIGLSLARDIVELHGGGISVRSELGRGSVFTISMPTGQVDEGEPIEELRAAMPSQLSDLLPAPAAGPAPRPEGGRALVLVVDDNPDLRAYLAAFLGEEYEVLTAVDGLEGLAAARSRRPDLVVSDVMMPRMDGYALCAELKRDPELAQVPLILLTARAEEGMKLAGYGLGADDYLGKPFSAEELLAKIRVFLGREALRRELDSLAARLREANERLEDKVRERTAQLEERFYQILDSLAAALEEKDPYTQGHSLRVESYSLMLADELGLPAEAAAELSVAARLHDIGKIGIPEHILNKPGPLSEAESAVIRTHPERGARILSPLSGIEPIVEAVLKHHERFDGSGYLRCPRQEVPMIASILALADAFDAMTSTRAYRPAMAAEAALAEIERGAGSQFDPALARAFAAAARSRWNLGPGRGGGAA